MYLSALLIAWHLQKQYPETVVSSWLSRDPILKYPINYEGTLLPDDGIIYLIDNPELSLPVRRLSKNMILFTGRCAHLSESVSFRKRSQRENCCPFCRSSTTVMTAGIRV